MNTLSSRIARNTALVAIAGAAVLTFAGPALAGEATYELPQPVVVAKSRADVHAEVLQARAAGTLLLTEASLQKSAPFASQKTRAEVAAELRNAADFAAIHGEPHDFTVTARTARIDSARVIAAR
jgi:hypothetical protein